MRYPTFESGGDESREAVEAGAISPESLEARGGNSNKQEVFINKGNRNGGRPISKTSEG